MKKIRKKRCMGTRIEIARTGKDFNAGFPMFTL